MNFLISFIQFLDAKATTPTVFGWYHIMWLVIVGVGTALLCKFGKNASARQVQNVVLGTAVLVIILEIYKQINYTFEVKNGVIEAAYQWYAFPWQFCSTPMYVGLLAGLIRKGKVHDSLCAYLATYAMFAGLAVMVYPGDAYVSTIGINIQTMICHGSMITIGAYLLATGHVKLEQKTILKALPVFAVTVLIAVILNELAFYTGLLEEHTFNMFFISRHCECTLPVYSLVTKAVPYPWCLVLYIWGFTTASWLILLICQGIGKLANRKKQAVLTV